MVTSAYSSSFLECQYKLKIMTLKENEVEFKVLEQESSPGCKKPDIINIPRKFIKPQDFNFTVNPTFQAKMFQYSGMGSNGPVSGTKWEFSKKSTK